MENDNNQKSILSTSQMYGYLQKKSRSFLGNWQKRFFVLLDNRIQYYQEQNLKQKKGDIFLTKIRNLIPIDQTQFQFDYDQRKYNMKCQDRFERNQWMRIIQIRLQNIKQSKNKKKGNKKTGNQKSFKKLILFNPYAQQIKNLFKQLHLTEILIKFSQETIFNRTAYLETHQGIYWLISFKGFQLQQEDPPLFFKDDFSPVELNVLYVKSIKDFKNRKIASSKDIKKIENDPSSIHIIIESKQEICIDTQTIPMNNSSYFQKCLKKGVQIGKQFYNDQNYVIALNVDSLVSFFDEKFSFLQDKINQNIQAILKPKIKQKDSKADSFLFKIRKVIFHLQEIKKALIVKSPKRTDIFQFYCKKCHSVIFKAFQDGWKIHYIQMNLDQIKILYDLVFEYLEITKDYFKDQRMQRGIKNLFKILLKQIQNDMIETINQNLERSESIEMNGVWSNSANIIIVQCLQNDFKKLISRQKNHPMIFRQTVKFIKYIFKMYSQKISFKIENWNNTSLLLGSTNDINKIIELVSKNLKKYICSDNQKLNLIFQQECSKIVNHLLLNTQISLIKKIFCISFSKIDRKILNLNLGQINMAKVTQSVQEQIKKFNKITQQVKEKLYMTSFDQVCNFYFTCITKFLNTQEFSPIIIVKKIQTDLQRIRERYQNILSEDDIKRNIDDLMILSDIISCQQKKVYKKVRISKTIFGNALTNEVIKNVISLRPQNSQRKKSLYEQCLAILQSNQIVKVSSSQEKNLRVQNLFDTWNQSRSRSNSLSNSDFYGCSTQVQLLSLTKDCKQGFLMKKKIMKTMPSIFYKAYFRLQLGKLYEYSSESSDSPTNVISMIDVQNCFINCEDEKIIMVEDKDQIIQLKASTQSQAKQWMLKMNEEMRNQVRKSKVQEQQQLFKDYFSQTSTQPMSNKKIGNSPKKLQKKMSQGISCTSVKTMFFF